MIDFAIGVAVHLLGRYCNRPSPEVERVRRLIERANAEHMTRAYSPRSTARARRLDAGEVNAVVQAYQRTKNMRAVARELSLSRETVAKYLRAAGVDTSKRMAESQISVAAQLYEDGLSSMAISARLGFDNHTIIAALRGRGIAIRRALGR